ncbi:MAG: dUTP diphosphatase [Calditrichaeota bacterium]|nr:MAG: dUTP diphosphatase [Calditrichota bacterium]
MKVRIYRKNKDIPLPVRKTPLAAGLDVYSSESVRLQAGVPALIPTGLIVEAPPGYFIRMHIRSGIALKYGLSLVNDVGIIDGDYCGPDDELKIAVVRHYNPADPAAGQPLEIPRGTRIGQIIFERLDLPEVEWDEQDRPDFARPSRGGFGSTGER